jgi:hypothetical protein
VRISVVTIRCRVCGMLLSLSTPRSYTDAEWAATPEDDREISQPPVGCSPAFARWEACPNHPAGPPDLGLSYSKDALPLTWAVDVVETPVLELGAGDAVRCDEIADPHPAHVWDDDEFPGDWMLCLGEPL